MAQATISGSRIKFGVDLLALEMETALDDMINQAKAETLKLQRTGLTNAQAVRQVRADLKNFSDPNYSGIFSGYKRRINTLVREHEKANVAKPVEEIGKKNKNGIIIFTKNFGRTMTVDFFS